MRCVYLISPLYKVMATQAFIAHLDIYGKFIFLLQQFLLGNHPDEYDLEYKNDDFKCETLNEIGRVYKSKELSFYVFKSYFATAQSYDEATQDLSLCAGTVVVWELAKNVYALKEFLPSASKLQMPNTTTTTTTTIKNLWSLTLRKEIGAVNVAVIGDVNVGKTYVANLLLGKSVLPEKSPSSLVNGFVTGGLYHVVDTKPPAHLNEFKSFVKNQILLSFNGEGSYQTLNVLAYVIKLRLTSDDVDALFDLCRFLEDKPETKLVLIINRVSKKKSREDLEVFAKTNIDKLHEYGTAKIRSIIKHIGRKNIFHILDQKEGAVIDRDSPFYDYYCETVKAICTAKNAPQK